MAYAEQNEENDMFARKTIAPIARRTDFRAKPKSITRRRFEKLYKNVTRRIPKTLEILAK